jgi:hypothetical protein
MDEQHLNTYLNFIEALLHCAKGEEWLLLQQHENLIGSELLTVMEQVSNQLNAEGNVSAAKFLHYWAVQLTQLHHRATAEETPEESRSASYLQLIQTLLSCSKGDEVAILNQNLKLMDEGLVDMMSQVAAQLATQGNQNIAIYLKHLAAEVNRVWLTPSTETNTTPSNLENSHSNELLEQLSQRLEKLELLLGKQSMTPPNPLWYMPILEEVDAHSWIISSEEVEQLIGIKPYCASGQNFFVRGCWKFVKVGKVGTHSSWRVIKEIPTLPIDFTSAPEGNSLKEDLVSPWSDNN